MGGMMTSEKLGKVFAVKMFNNRRDEGFPKLDLNIPHNIYKFA